MRKNGLQAREFEAHADRERTRIECRKRAIEIGATIAQAITRAVEPVHRHHGHIRRDDIGA
ncbi:hypothetical protein D3C83_180280 [compost metagenome]